MSIARGIITNANYDKKAELNETLYGCCQLLQKRSGESRPNASDEVLMIHSVYKQQQ